MLYTFPHVKQTFQFALELLITLWINSRCSFVSKHLRRLVENIQNARSYWYIIHFIHNALMFLLDKMCWHVGTSHVSYTYPSKKTLTMVLTWRRKEQKEIETLLKNILSHHHDLISSFIPLNSAGANFIVTKIKHKVLTWVKLAFPFHVTQTKVPTTHTSSSSTIDSLEIFNITLY